MFGTSVLSNVVSDKSNKSELGTHPAVLAWNQMGQKSHFPVRVEELINPRKARVKNPKSRIFRLHGVAGKEKSIIAKLCKTEAAVSMSMPM